MLGRAHVVCVAQSIIELPVIIWCEASECHASGATLSFEMI